MSNKKGLVIVLVFSLVLVSTGIVTQSTAHALPSIEASSTGVSIPYAGRLTNAAGEPVADGVYDFTFALYDAESSGSPLWAETQHGVTVKGGTIAVSLGALNPLGALALDGGKRWLAVGVRGPSERDYTTLTPRQALGTGSSAPPAAPAAGPSCPHNHFGESWSGNGVWGLYADTINGNLSGALFGRTYGIGSGVYGDANASSSINMGVLGTSNSSNGYGGKFENSGGGISLYAVNTSGGRAVYAEGNGGGSLNAALRVKNTNTSNGIATYMTSNSGYPTLEIDKVNPGGAAIDLQLFNAGNLNPSHFIAAYDESATLQVLVASSGVIAANGYIDWGADIADMLPAVEGLAPGDVLAIGPDGKLIRTTESYQTSVAGVYSTNPGFIGGHPVSGAIPGTIPLALTGVVPVKVSAENGAIRPGDLLVASSIPGHAMKAGANPPQGTIIGKALEKWDTGTGVINLLAMLQ